jgi:flavin-dependent dehydrogenase
LTQSITDILVIGGGPAGCTAATLLCQRGYKVTLVEKDRFPRFHIGESLLPMNLPIFERMGVLDAVREIGVLKYGADFSQPGDGSDYNVFYFDEALGDSPEHAFQVKRADFDQVLIEHCRDVGVHVLEETRIIRCVSQKGNVQKVEAVDRDGKEKTWQARFVIDASGRDTFFSSTNRWKRRNPRHASAAVYAHFRGVKRRPDKENGNISIYWFDKGWVWLIPLDDELMSIGAVCSPEYLKTRERELDDFLWQTLVSFREIAKRVSGAEQVMPAEATGNYSYLSERMSGPGFVIVGDAYAFVDPIFSSGVYLAMSSAEEAVPVAEAWISGNGIRYWWAVRRFERRVKRGISTFSWFIYRFTSPAMRTLMGDPRNVFGVVQAVISMLAGDVYDNGRVKRRLWIFKSIYAVARLFERFQNAPDSAGPKYKHS